jgi:hypothetical protein
LVLHFADWIQTKHGSQIGALLLPTFQCIAFVFHKKRFYEIINLKLPEIVSGLANTNEPYGQLVLMTDADDNASFGGSIQLGHYQPGNI